MPLRATLPCALLSREASGQLLPAQPSPRGRRAPCVVNSPHLELTGGVSVCACVCVCMRDTTCERECGHLRLVGQGLAKHLCL